MLSLIVQWLAKSNAAKVGTGAMTGGGFLALIFTLHQDVKSDIRQETMDRKEYVELVVKPLKEDTKETKQLVKEIRDYLIKQKNP